eukprot:scaffold30465_cov112-Isochrysis_galbana.AAC.2
MFLSLSSSKHSVGTTNLVSVIQEAFTEPPRARPMAKTKPPADAGCRDRGGPVAGGGPLRRDGELGSYGVWS